MQRLDTYTIINKSILNDSDREVLYMLYTPIIGYGAVSLYFGLITELKRGNATNTHLHLIASLSMKLDDIISNREKLEAIGLLKTYLKEDNYIYELYSPLTANEFLTHPILPTSLLSSISKIEYDKIVNYFKIPKINMNGYKNISKHFQDIFTMEMDHLADAKDINKKEKTDIIVDDIVDFDLLLTSMNNMVNSNIFNDDNKKLINTLAYLYNFDNVTMSNLIKDSINERGMINTEELKSNSEKYYTFENNKEPRLIYTKKDKIEKKITKNTKEDLIEFFSTTTPYDFLVSKYNGAKPTEKDVKLIESMLVNQKLNPGVVNVLIDYVLRINNNKLTKGYVESIASNWKISNINTVEEAMAIALKEHNNKYHKKENLKEKLPSWYGVNVKKQEMTDDEVKELNNILSDFK